MDIIPVSYTHLIPFVKEGTNVTVKFFKGNAFSVAAPNFVELEITDTEPGFKGDTASNTYKPVSYTHLLWAAGSVTSPRRSIAPS